MDMTSNKNISREFRKVINKATLWRNGNNPVITVETTEPNKDHKKVRSNELWGKPFSFSMK